MQQRSELLSLNLWNLENRQMQSQFSLLCSWLTGCSLWRRPLAWGLLHRQEAGRAGGVTYRRAKYQYHLQAQLASRQGFSFSGFQS